MKPNEKRTRNSYNNGGKNQAGKINEKERETGKGSRVHI